MPLRAALLQRLEQLAGMSMSPTLLRYFTLAKSTIPFVTSAYRRSVSALAWICRSKLTPSPWSFGSLLT